MTARREGLENGKAIRFGTTRLDGAPRKVSVKTVPPPPPQEVVIRQRPQIVLPVCPECGKVRLRVYHTEGRIRYVKCYADKSGCGYTDKVTA